MEYVALYEKHKYVLGYFNSNGGFQNEWKKSFPSIFKSEVDNSLLDQIPNVGYEEGEYEYTIWDKSMNEKNDLAVPVYARVFNEYKYTGKTHTFEIPTKEALEAARKIVDTVLYRMELEKYKDSIKKLEELLKAGKGICFVSGNEMPEIFRVCKYSGKSRLWYDDFYNHVVGDPNMVISTTLKLYVPKKLMPKIIGKGGKNVKEMAATMRVERIKVLPIEDKSGD